MAKTPSSMKMQLGEQAPDFTLPDPTGKKFKLSDFHGKKATVVMFACNHCPFVVHVKDEVAAIAKEYVPKGVALIAINSNDVNTHPDDSPEKMKIFASQNGWQFPYLFDETQDVARSYHAACTPDFFVFDANHKLVYRGQLDDSRPGNEHPVTGKDLREALDNIVVGRAVPANQKPSLGCNIKWKP
jgi:peroxiredoxin